MMYRAGRSLLLVAVVLTVMVLYVSVDPVLARGPWLGEYFANQYLSGEPAFTRQDDALAFDWRKGGPGGGLPDDGFSARWTRDDSFDAGTYRFSYRSDDGIRVWVGDLLVVDDWRDHGATWSLVDRVIPQGTHRVVVEYYEHTGTAAVQVDWERIRGRGGWRGEYYDNRSLSGSPILTRDDQAVDFNWRGASPDSAVPADNFSVRWTRTLGFTAGAYRFYASCDDGVRVYVDGGRLIDAWTDQELPNTHTGDITLGDGHHTVVVEYYDHGGDAAAHVWWNLLTTFSGWQGRYYDNTEMRGGPALIRDDAAINFDWGESAPADWMPADGFGVVWTRQASFSPGYYRFNVRSDDGVRFWLDGALVMDYWSPQDYSWHYLDGTYLEGVHTLRVAYFEGAGGARVRFWWEPSGTIPSPDDGQPPPASAPTAPGPWRGEYFNGQDMGGTPALVRSDAAIDFNWGWEAPGPGIDRDNFSVRWSGTFDFAAGRYRFSTTTDDGVRLYVDDGLLVDAWNPMRGSRSSYVTLSQGRHTVRVEYFEQRQAAMARVTWRQVSTEVASPRPQPSTVPACVGGALQLDAWPVARVCDAGGGGWMATIFVQGHGGDCRYTYYWEDQVRGGPVTGPMTFDVNSASRGSAILGYAAVTSAGQTARVPIFVRHPDCP